jgi:hypothetical protein
LFIAYTLLHDASVLKLSSPDMAAVSEPLHINSVFSLLAPHHRTFGTGDICWESQLSGFLAPQ